MLAEFIVMFREGLEVAFVLGIILAYLHKTRNHGLEKHVWLGASAGLLLSIALALVFQSVHGGFEANEELFEGFFMVLTAALVSWLILWVVRQKHVVDSLRDDVRLSLRKNSGISLFLLAMSAIVREGVEAVLFMAGILLSTGGFSLLGAFLGLAAAVFLGVLVFEYSLKFDIGTFFRISTIILVLLAAGLFSQGVHELQEAGALPVFAEHIYDLNPPQNPDGSYPALHENGPVGSILKGLVGYDGAPSALQAASYLFYLASIYAFYKTS